MRSEAIAYLNRDPMLDALQAFAYAAMSPAHWLWADGDGAAFSASNIVIVAQPQDRHYRVEASKGR